MCFVTVKSEFLLFLFITIESAFKMAHMKVLFNSVSLCVTMLTDPLTWTVIELYSTKNSNDPLGLSKCM